jgi:hypothetical protein
MVNYDTLRAESLERRIEALETKPETLDEFLGRAIDGEESRKEVRDLILNSINAERERCINIFEACIERVGQTAHGVDLTKYLDAIRSGEPLRVR